MTDSRAGKILVLESGKPGALAVIRDLGRAGLHVIAGESHRFTIGGLSRYCSGSLLHPSIETDRAAFQRFLLDIAAGFEMIFPLADLSTCAVMEISHELSKHTRLAVAPADSYDLVLDKAETARVASDAGVPIPRTWVPGTEEEIRALSDEFSWPIVVKSRIGQYWDGNKFSINKVTARNYVSCLDELILRWREVNASCPRPVLQEYIPGEGLGYFALYYHGKLYAQFAHRRLREYPITGGSSCFRESVSGAEMKESALKMLEALKWSGVAMLEFRRDRRDGTIKLLEVNGRWWGSLPLALTSGVRFPSLFYRALKGESPEPVLSYSLGKRCRLLLPNDLLWFWASLLTRRDRLAVIREFFDFSNQDFDIISLRDPLPAVGALWTMARHFGMILSRRETLSGEYR